MESLTAVGLLLLFWSGLAYLVYVEIGYLVILYILSRFRPRTFIYDENVIPSISVLLAVHNEEKVITQKLDNLLEQNYPAMSLQIIVASDHSMDRTDELINGYAGRGVLLIRTDKHEGKIAALRAAEPLISGEVVVFTDADSFFKPGALAMLARHFSDPQVGAVSGRETRPPDNASGKGKGEGLYNRIETQVKRLESLVGSQVLLHGGIFAIRRELLPYVPDHLTHDAIVPLDLALKGYKVRYESEAVSEEAYDLDTCQDWKRRIRTVMQAFQSYLYVKRALNPLNTGMYALQIWSHRFMRWFVFPVLLLVFISNLLLFPTSPFYQGLFTLQIICYTLALAGFLFDKTNKHPYIFYFPFYFLYIHLAAIYAILMSWQGKQIATWSPAQRLAETQDAN